MDSEWDFESEVRKQQNIYTVDEYEFMYAVIVATHHCSHIQ